MGWLEIGLNSELVTLPGVANSYSIALDKLLTVRDDWETPSVLKGPRMGSGA
jgi:hypothetical protein